MKLKRKKVGDRSYELVDWGTGKVIATAVQTGEHGRDNYPWEWSLSDDMIFGNLGLRTGHSTDSLREIVDIVESNGNYYGLLKPVGKVDPFEIKEGQVFRAMINGLNYFFRATQDAYGENEARIPANNAKGELTEVLIPQGDTVLLYTEDLDRDTKREAAIERAKEEDATKESALKAMVRKLDERPRGHLGYVTNRDELIAILQELTPLLSVSILEENIQYNAERGGKDVSVEIKLGFTLERDLL